MPSNFNEPDKGKTWRLFMFREFEKTTEKKTPGVSFFVKLCLSSPKKYKTMLERTPDHYDRGVLFMCTDVNLKK